MRVLVAGATGAIGTWLVPALLRAGHQTTGLVRSGVAAEALKRQGADAVLADIFDQGAVERAVLQAHPEVIIDELTSIPKRLADFTAEARTRDIELRLKGGGNLLRAARSAGVRRTLVQSSGYFLRPGQGLADESEALAVDASDMIAGAARLYETIEARVLSAPNLEAVALRYGFFYGPRTWYWPDGSAAESVRQRQSPIIGDGGAVWSFVHVEDAADATVAALAAPPGIYNVVDDDPTPVREYLPAFARWIGAPPPPHVSEQELLSRAGAEGPDLVYYGTRLRGASNAKARKVLGFRPRRLVWMSS